MLSNGSLSFSECFVVSVGTCCRLRVMKTLNSWRDIASYLGRSVRTVQRWESDFGLPVHRAGNNKRSALALSSELDEWLRRHP